ncbi:uncharacterized protein [Dendrobates tinctorius]|uniref:uncharacterized protein isoform X1 n=1 Tax=Dendrobates tinctorius TaxID=92724 RepID=UPI003CC9E6C1
MSSSGSPPSHRQRNEEAEPEGLSEGDGRSGEMPGVGSPHASESVARPRVPQSASQSRRQPRRGGRHRVRFFFFRTFIRFVHNAVIVMFTFFVFKQASQRAHDSDSEDVAIDVDLLIDMVRDREPLWNMADRFHADACVTRRLWEEVCQAVLSNWEELHSRAQKEQRKYSHFSNVSGCIVLDPNHFVFSIFRGKSSVAVAVNAGSLQEGVQQRDAGSQRIKRTQEPL